MATEPRHGPATRRAAERRGRHAEIVAAWYLRLKGYRLLDRRFRAPMGEIDLVMRRGRTIIFVEVKYRPEEIVALSAVTSKGRRRIVRAAEFWLAQRAMPGDTDIRFDVLTLAPRRLPRHHRGLFDGGGAPW
jgi:putative endonuclease